MEYNYMQKSYCSLPPVCTSTCYGILNFIILNFSKGDIEIAKEKESKLIQHYGTLADSCQAEELQK